MHKNLERIKKVTILTGHILTFVQIVSITLILLASLYWFFELVEINILNFLTPMMNAIKTTMQANFGEQLEKGQAGIDGSLFIFIALTGLLIYFVA